MNLQDNVKQYYGEALSSSEDLATDACCTVEDTPAWLAAVFADIHPEVSARYFGCGLVAPPMLAGARVLDLGAGSGRDAFALARLVGETGSVVGVDMTGAQLAVARAHEDWHAERFGYAKPNTSFLEGDIERLDALDLPAESFDVIVSNCVINLCEDKEAVFRAARDLLKPGGEFFFADVYADRRLPEDVKEDKRAHGECLAGALYWNDFHRLADATGFAAPRLAVSRPLSVNDDDLKALLAPASFVSATARLFKVGGLEGTPEDYGQTARYLGGVNEAPEVFALDICNVFPKGQPKPVSGDVAAILAASRFAPFFEIAEKGPHRGAFPEPARPSPFGKVETPKNSSSGCC